MPVNSTPTVLRWALPDLIQKFGLVQAARAPSNVLPFQVPDWAVDTKPPAALAHLPMESLADGLEPNLDEIRAAAATIPPSAIAAEPEWVKVARALAHEAAVYK